MTLKLKKRKLIKKKKDTEKLCKCGCNSVLKNPNNSYIRGHNNKNGSCNLQRTGRPQGSRNKVSIIAENLFTDRVEAISEVIINEALHGRGSSKIVASKYVMDKILPNKKHVVIKLNGFPKIKSIQDAEKGLTVILNAVTSGQISVSDGECLSRVVEKFLSATKVEELEKQLQEILEQLEQ